MATRGECESGLDGVALKLPTRLEAARRFVRKELLAARAPAGHWEGELSASALATATAVCALAVVERQGGWCGAELGLRITQGLEWLAANVNADGGWGDTALSLSNLSTTALVWAAFGAVPGADVRYRAVVCGAESWLTERVGRLSPPRLAAAIIERYGRDRTFSAPILTQCALAGRLGGGREAWRWVWPLPFELAVLPHQWFAAVRLPVVSYALPALIAVGQARQWHRPPRNPFARLIRDRCRERTLGVLTTIQPASGGFLEATPLTSFVAMSLAGSGHVTHQVTRRSVEFLLASGRPDGSWSVERNLSTWLTTLSVNALAAGEEAGSDPKEPSAGLRPDERRLIRDWLLRQQYRAEHPYTHAAPGGWAWTDLPGGVPDADDTAGALLALRHLGEIDGRVRDAAVAGVNWLVDLQNDDGGLPTFCRGWGHLPFDRSSPDLTAHALRAWQAWAADVGEADGRRVRRAAARALGFLQATARNGWRPLWFGNQLAPEETNLTYGTSRVALAVSAAAAAGQPAPGPAMASAGAYLLQTQREDGSWGGFPGGPASVEETALAVEALGGLRRGRRAMEEAGWGKPMDAALGRGVGWLIDQVETGAWKHPSPIGFYFARLWYFERLYPMIFTVAALERAGRVTRESFS